MIMIGGIDSNQDVSDGDYRSNIAFKASREQMYTFEAPYTFGTWSGSVLTWEVLTVDRTNKRVLLVTQNVIGNNTMNFKGDNMTTLSDYGTPYWRDSNPRKWLRETFYPSAFTAEEKGKIAELILTESAQDGYKDVIDTVFLLSKTEVESYHPSNLNVNWWLRSLESKASYVHFGQNIGGVGKVGVSQTNYYYIRPALWLKYGN